MTKTGIHISRNLSQAKVANPKQADLSRQAMDRAMRYLGYRPRSNSEVEARLKRYGYDDAIIETTAQRLRDCGLLDDVAFAAFWKESRSNSSTRSGRLLAQELRQKGISTDIIAKTIEDMDDDAEAYWAGNKKAHSLNKVDYLEFRKKLSGFLRRRGFGYETIQSAISQLWEEKLSEDTK